jgi:6-dehydroglucose reductase
MDALPIARTRRPLGGSGLDAFPIAYGCWRLFGTEVASAREKVEAALALGIDLFDHADLYGRGESGPVIGQAEAVFGRVLADAPSLRDRMLIATKGGIAPPVPYDSSGAYLVAACEASLKRLGVDGIDVYQIHRPDWLAHPAETAGALERLRESGKIRAIGVSNFTTAQYDALQRHLPVPIATHQPEFSAWHLDPLRDGVLDQCMRDGVTPLAWSPLAGGRLGLSIEAARAEPNGARLAALLARLDEIAAREGVPRTAVALAWLLAHPSGAIPIVGTQQPARLAEAVRAFDVRLTRKDWYDVVIASQGARMP